MAQTIIAILALVVFAAIIFMVGFAIGSSRARKKIVSEGATASPQTGFNGGGTTAPRNSSGWE